MRPVISCDSAPVPLREKLIPFNPRCASRFKSSLAYWTTRLKDKSLNDKSLNDETASEPDEEVVETKVPVRDAHRHQNLTLDSAPTLARCPCPFRTISLPTPR